MKNLTKNDKNKDINPHVDLTGDIATIQSARLVYDSLKIKFDSYQDELDYVSYAYMNIFNEENKSVNEFFNVDYDSTNQIYVCTNNGTKSTGFDLSSTLEFYENSANQEYMFGLKFNEDGTGESFYEDGTSTGRLYSYKINGDTMEVDASHLYNQLTIYYGASGWEANGASKATMNVINEDGNSVAENFTCLFQDGQTRIVCKNNKYKGLDLSSVLKVFDNSNGFLFGLKFKEDGTGEYVDEQGVVTGSKFTYRMSDNRMFTSPA